MKKIIYTTIFLLLFFSGFCFARGTWTVDEVTLSRYPVVINGEPYFIEGTVTGDNLDDNSSDPIKIEIGLFVVDGGRNEKVLSQSCKATASPAGDIWSGKCPFSFWHQIIGDKTQMAQQPKKMDFEIRLYPDGKDGTNKSDVLWTHGFTVPLIVPGDIVASPTIVTDAPTVLTPITSETLTEFAERIINIIFWIITSFAFVMIMIGGFIMVTAGGNPQRITKGRNTIFFAIAGFAIVSLSRGIVTLVQAIMGAKSSSG